MTSTVMAGLAVIIGDGAEFEDLGAVRQLGSARRERRRGRCMPNLYI